MVGCFWGGFLFCFLCLVFRLHTLSLHHGMENAEGTMAYSREGEHLQGLAVCMHSQWCLTYMTGLHRLLPIVKLHHGNPYPDPMG
jgi:hypothetical protein